MVTTRVSWKQEDSKTTFSGPMWNGYCCGLHISGYPEKIQITPIKKDGQTAQGYFEVPKNKIEELVRELRRFV